jgi:hypothetical protein
VGVVGLEGDLELELELGLPELGLPELGLPELGLLVLDLRLELVLELGPEVVHYPMLASHSVSVVTAVAVFSDVQL